MANIFQVIKTRLVPSVYGKKRQVYQTEIADDIYFASRIWYGGNPEELKQLYSGDNKTMRFWGGSPSAGEIRRIHSGIPSATINKLAEISANGFNEIQVDENQQELLDFILQKNNFVDDLETVARDSILYGFGAWKIHFDERGMLKLSWYSYEDCYFETNGKRIEAVVFTKEIKGGKYVINEVYKTGSITVEIKNKEGRPVSLTEAPAEFWKYKENECHWDGDFSLAVPVVWGWSSRFPGKPEGIIASKFDDFDFLDETVSKAVEHMRDAEIKTFFPTTLLIKDQKPNPFDNRFLKHQGSAAQGAKNEITRLSEVMQISAYREAYEMALDLCLQGIISPSTLGIDTSNKENAEAQREREKTTVYSRNKIIKMLTKSIEELARAVLCAYYTANGNSTVNIEDMPVAVDFDEYISPDFDSIVTTVAKAGSCMSIEAKVEELWGNSKDEEWKKAEVQRLKIEQGLASGIETQVIDYDE